MGKIEAGSLMAFSFTPEQKYFVTLQRNFTVKIHEIKDSKVFGLVETRVTDQGIIGH